MHPSRFRRASVVAAILSIGACSKPAGVTMNASDSNGGTFSATATPAATPRASMGMMMGDSAMIMLAGFCGTQDGDSASGVRVDLVVNGEAADKASQVMINVVAADAGDLGADLVAGKDAHAMCGGHARRIYIGGSSMFLGNPMLTISSAVPVTIAARSTLGTMLGAPIEVKPREKGAVLKWDAAPAAKQ